MAHEGRRHVFGWPPSESLQGRKPRLRRRAAREAVTHKIRPCCAAENRAAGIRTAHRTDFRRKVRGRVCPKVSYPKALPRVAIFWNVSEYFNQGEKMGLQFRKSIKIVPGVRLNVGLRSTSLSVGGRGFSYNIGSKSSRVTVGIPGSGLSYSADVLHQNPVSLVANSSPTRRRYSVTPFVIAALVLGLLYIVFHSTTQSSMVPEVTVSGVAPESTDTTGSIATGIQEGNFAIDGPVPLSRPGPKLRAESAGRRPLQILPQE
jgi:hypothetical protein